MTASVIRDGEYRSATSNRVPPSCASRRATAISALRCFGGSCIQPSSTTPLRVLFQPEGRIDVCADLARDAGAFESRYPPIGGDCRRRSERWRAHDPVQISWMDRCVRHADANLIWPKRRGGSIFNPKHSRRFSEFVVDDSSHMNLHRLPAQPAARDRGATGRLSLRPRTSASPANPFSASVSASPISASK